MKKIFTFCFVALSAMMAQAQVAVTFNVDMTGQTVSANGVHMAGNFNDVNYDGTAENAAYVNWNPSAIALADQGNGIWSVTLNLVAERYEFKLINGNDWPFAEDVPPACQVEVNGNDNRFWSISGLNATESMTVCYESCAACGENTVRFRVDMTQESAGVNPAGIFVAGDFQGWNPAGSQLIDPDGNGTFEGYFSIGAASAANFKFINGNDWAFEESIPVDCNVSGNRNLAVSDANTVADVICFSACGPCQAPTPVLFRVDMTLQTVNANGPHVAGSFQGWNPGDAATLMTDPDGDNIYEVTLLLQPGTYQYKFVNGAAWADGNESLPADCNVGGNREVVVAADPVVEHFCYNQCGAECVVDPAAADITFRVNMFTTGASAAGVWMIGGFTTPVWQAGAVQMTDDNLDGVYECTVNVSGSADIQYKFVNGDVSVSTNEEAAGIMNCGIANGVGGYNRLHTRTGIAEVLNTVCFDSCADCIIGIQEAMALTVLNAYPVPANEFVTLSFGQVKSAPITVRVMNNLGQVVSSQYMGNLPTGNNQVRVNLEGVASGIYAIELSNGIERTAVQIAVQ
jgi:hypothetical protein